MDDIELMQIGDSTDYLLEISAGLILTNFILFNDIIKELSLLNVLHNQEQMPRCLYDLFYIRVTS